jgi:ABC-type ATPase involved in cell division
LMAAVQRFLADGVAVVVVSHEPEWASDLVHQRIALDRGRVIDGRVQQ